MRRLRVGVVFGGRSGEHEVSLRSASTVLQALDAGKYEVVPIGISKSGQWLLDGDPMRTLSAAAAAGASGGALDGQLIPSFGLGSLAGRRLDVVIPVLHGPYGEDGTIQGLLELAQIPYVGSGVLASAAGMDKAVMKDIFRQRGLPIVESMVVLRREWLSQSEHVQRRVAEKIGFPCFVKPANLGSSVGVSKASEASQLPRALDAAAAYDRKIIVERAVVGCRELEVGVLGNEDPIATVPGEVVTLNEFYDYVAKYTEGASRVFIPADLPDYVNVEARRIAVESYVALGCEGLARVDLFLSGGQLFVNEVNTLPGLTPTSMFHKLWAASGVELGELLDRLIGLALERFAERQAVRTSYQPLGDESLAA